MNIDNIEKGDYLLCRRTYSVFKDIKYKKYKMFIKNKKYRVDDVIYLNSGDGQREALLYNIDGYLFYTYKIYKHFYSKEEERKMKLKKLR
jgi:hypothetical protein